MRTVPVLIGLALIDCSASSETTGLLSQVINLDGCVVLANKKPLTSPLVGICFYIVYFAPIFGTGSVTWLSSSTTILKY